MVRLADISEPMRTRLAETTCPTYDDRPWVEGPPLERRRVALVSSAALQRAGDRPFDSRDPGYRIIAAEADGEILMSHVSPNFDRTGFQQDLNVIFSLDRLGELAAEGMIGSVAAYHYSFMGSVEPRALEPTGTALVELLRADSVDACLLLPV